ncbi:MAG: efflux RND transporter periplasmic adaptor subunit [Elusimicrobia bacterium]|nr:efflux RND transporter periplasmic adaptor subunit [Elusimicrobiota bacterium]
MKRILMAAAVILVAGALYYSYSHKKKNGAPQFVAVTATAGPIEEAVDTTGNVAPLNRVEVNPAVGGRVEKLLAEEGDTVKSGQLLAYISSTDRVAILDAAKARGEAELSKWANTYKPTPVLSPLDGRVIKRDVVQGQTVGTSSVMYALSDDLIVKAQVDESDIGRIKVGQRAEITLDAYPGKITMGTVFQILHEGVTVSNVITYYVKIRPDKVPPYFKSEMTANIKIIVSRKKDAVLLPSSALTDSPDGARCVYKGNPQRPELAPVRVGIDDGNNVEILSGVSAGETVYSGSGGYMPQLKEDSSNPFMPGRPKAKTNGGKSSKKTDQGPPPM